MNLKIELWKSIIDQTQFSQMISGEIDDGGNTKVFSNISKLIEKDQRSFNSLE